MMEQAQALIDAAGQNWVIALAVMFAAVVLDAAKPKTEEGGQVGGPLAWIATIANLAMPFLLLLHAFWRGIQADHPLALVYALAIVAGVVIAASALGMVLGLAIPPFRKLVRFAAPIAILAAFAFTVWVTWEAASQVLQLYVLQRLG